MATSYQDGEWKDMYSFCFVGSNADMHERIDITGNLIYVEHYIFIEELGVLPKSYRSDPYFIDYMMREYMPTGKQIAKQWNSGWECVGITRDACYVPVKKKDY